MLSNKMLSQLSSAITLFPDPNRHPLKTMSLQYLNIFDGIIQNKVKYLEITILDNCANYNGKY